MNSSAARTCARSSRTTKRTRIFVSTARMPLADVRPNGFLHIHRRFFPREFLLREQRVVDILRGIPSGPTNYHILALFVPLEHRPWPHAELLSNLRRHRDLALRGNFLIERSPPRYISTVMKRTQ